MNALKRIRPLLVTAGAALSGAVLAALSFTPSQQLFGYIAPPALSGSDLESGSVKAFVPWFDFDGYHGDILAAPVSQTGAINLLQPTWRAAVVLNDEIAENANFWDTGRFIVTMHTNGAPVPFRLANLASTQVDALATNEDERIKYLRGKRTLEGTTFRTRTSVLGDIIHSDPTYVGAPSGGHATDGYQSFAFANSSRPGRLYVGANDGLLHAFDAATGAETFAYLPSMLIPTLKAYSDSTYTHQYYVDGRLTAADAYFSGAWHTMLVGGLGAGGKGLFALDVTSAAAIANEGNTGTGAGSRVKWELSPASTGATNLGYTYSRPSIVKMQNGQWAAVIGNGYLSSTGVASLYVLDLATGAVVREIVTPDNAANGLSSPTLVDSDADGMVDSAYAGDLNGNLWKFDLSSATPSEWALAYGNTPVLRTDSNGSVRNAITTAPEVGLHPEAGLMVYVATGRMFNMPDISDLFPQAVYGLWDHSWSSANLPLTDADLVTQTLTEVTHPVTGAQVRTASANPVDWDSKRGWKTSLEPANAAEIQKGGRVIQDMALRSGRLQFVASNPSSEVGTNWLMQLNGMTGGAPDETVLDLNDDGNFDVLDNADGNGDGEVTDVPEDRVVGEFQQYGLASRPIFARINDYGEAALINHLAFVDQAHTDTPSGTDPGDDDFGIIGGHFDLDVSSRTYPFDTGSTDKHKHEWDNSYGATVDYYNVLGGFRSVDDGTGLPGSSSSQRFLITLSNAHLSPAAILEINSVSFPVEDYRALMKRYISGNVGAGEAFPVFKLGAVTAGEAAAGIVQLTSLRLKFPADAIARGGIHPSVTGCVRGNKKSPGGAYRNGALTVQLLNASSITGPYSYDPAAQVYSMPAGGSHKIHKLGYAVPVNGVHQLGDGMLYESAIFWHWSGPCYSLGKEAEYAEEYADEVGEPDDRGSDDDIYGGPLGGGGDDIGGDDDDDDDREEDAEVHEVSATRVSAGEQVGRLFWREMIPGD